MVNNNYFINRKRIKLGQFAVCFREEFIQIIDQSDYCNLCYDYNVYLYDENKEIEAVNKYLSMVYDLELKAGGIAFEEDLENDFLRLVLEDTSYFEEVKDINEVAFDIYDQYLEIQMLKGNVILNIEKDKNISYHRSSELDELAIREIKKSGIVDNFFESLTPEVKKQIYIISHRIDVAVIPLNKL